VHANKATACQAWLKKCGSFHHSWQAAGAAAAAAPAALSCHVVHADKAAACQAWLTKCGSFHHSFAMYPLLLLLHLLLLSAGMSCMLTKQQYVRRC
jgi:hypothetical protein